MITDHHLTLFEATDVTDEILAAAWRITDGWYATQPIDWDDVWDRLDGTELADGRTLDLGAQLASPALIKIKQTVFKWRREQR